MFVHKNFSTAVCIIVAISVGSITNSWALDVEDEVSQNQVEATGKFLSLSAVLGENQKDKLGQRLPATSDIETLRKVGNDDRLPVKIKKVVYNIRGAVNKIITYNLTLGPRFPRQSVSNIVFKKRMTTGELIESAGFKWNEREVKTEDGYYLKLFRIIPPCSIDSSEDTKFGSVFFQHGFLGSSSEWFLGNLENSLPLRFAALGFEVWLGNSRGNEYSLRHERLSSKSPEFWDFSLDEMGRYDIKAAIDYIIKLGNQGIPSNSDNDDDENPYQNFLSRIFLFGHGLGNAMFYIFMSEHKQTYGSRIDGIVSISPTALTSRMTSPVKYLAPFAKTYVPFQYNGPLLPSTLNSFLRSAIPEFCPIRKHGQSLCSAALFLTYGKSSIDENATTVENIYRHLPSTTSIKALVHYLQLTEIEEFRNFDYGTVKNFKKYNQTAPIKYVLFRTKVPSLNFYGEKDILLDPRDAEQTISQLGVGRKKQTILFMDYVSPDFLFGDVAPVIIKDIAVNFIFDVFLKPAGTEPDGRTCDCACNGFPLTEPSKSTTSPSYFSQFVRPS